MRKRAATTCAAFLLAGLAMAQNPNHWQNIYTAPGLPLDGTETVLMQLITGTCLSGPTPVPSTCQRYMSTQNIADLVGAISDTFLSVEVDGVPVSTLAPTFNFLGSDFVLVESPADDFALSINSSIARDTELHVAVVLAGTPDYIVAGGTDAQTLTLGLIDLATDVTGQLPNANLANMPTDTVKMRNAAGSGPPEDLKIGALADNASPASTDNLLAETTGGDLVRIQVGNLPVGGAALTVEEADGAPTVANVDTIQFNQVDGLAVVDETGGQVQVNLTLAGDVDGSGGANDLDELAVEAELEAVMDLQDLQGAATDGQIPTGISRDTEAPAAGDVGGSLAAGYTVSDVQPNAVDLGAETVGNYVEDVAAGIGVAVTGSGGEGATPAAAFDFSDAGADPVLGAGGARFSNEGASAAGLVFEGDTDNAFETRLRVTDPTAERIVTIPDVGGEVTLLGQQIDLTSEVGGSLPLAGDVDGDHGANDLDELAVEAELEAVMDLQDLQGAVTDGQIPTGISRDTEAPAAGDVGGTLAAGYTVSSLQPDTLDAMAEIAAAIKRGPDATDTHLLTTDVVAPGALTCLNMDTDGSVVLAGGACGVAGGDPDQAWNELLAPTAATLFTSNATAETFTLSMESNFTTGPQILFRSQMGTPSGGELVSIRSHDADLFPLTIHGSGGEVITFANSGSVSAAAYNARGSATLVVQSRSFAVADNAVDLGGGTHSNSSGNSIVLRLNPTYNQTGTAGGTDLMVDRTETLIGSGAHNLMDLRRGGASQFRVDRLGELFSATIDTANNTLSVAGADVNSGTIPVARVGADHLDAMSELAAGIKRGPDATDTHLLTTDVAAPGALDCLEMDTDGSVVLSGAPCGGGSSLTVEEADLVPTVASVNTIQFNQADGLAVVDETGGQVQVNLTLVGEASGSGGATIVTDVQPNAVDLGAETVGDYVEALTAGIGVAVTGSGGEGATPAAAFDFSDAGADPVLGPGGARFSNEGASAAGLVFEGDTDNAFETRLRVTDPTAERIVTIPDLGGEISLLGQSIDLASAEVTGSLPLAGDVDGDHGANDLDEVAVQAELEGVLILSNLQGAVTDGQVPSGISRDTEAPAAGDVGGTLAAGYTVTGLQADALAAVSEIAAAIKRGPDATDTHLLTTDVVAPGALTCLNMDTDGSVVLAAGACGVAGGAPLTVEEADGTPTVANVTTIQFNQADGFSVTDETAGQIQVDLSVAAGAYAAASIDGDDLATSIAGAHLVLAAASPDVIDAEASLTTHTKTVSIFSPTTADDAKIRFVLDGDAATTITRFWCDTDIGTIAINLEERTDTGPNTVGTDVASSDVICDPDSQVATLSNTSIDLNDPLALMISSASTPGVVNVHVRYTVDE